MNDLGVLTVFFDVPSKTKADAKAYRALHRTLRSEGFNQLQESVYVKLIRHYADRQREMNRVRAALPAVGSIIILPLRIGELREICTVSGKPFDVHLFSDDIITF